MSIRLAKVVASAGGTGFLPIAPGTWASLFAVLIWMLIFSFIPSTTWWQSGLILTSLIAGLWSCNRLADVWGKDPSQIVIDEVAGMWLACFLLPIDWKWMLGAFAAFRVFDIAKPLGIRKAEKLKGGWGVMMDDVLAGIAANVVVRIAGTFL